MSQRTPLRRGAGVTAAIVALLVAGATVAAALDTGPLSVSASNDLIDGQTIQVGGPGSGENVTIAVCDASTDFNQLGPLNPCGSHVTWFGDDPPTVDFVVNGDIPERDLAGFIQIPAVNCWVTDCVVARYGVDFIGGGGPRGADFAYTAPITFAPLIRATPATQLAGGTDVTVKLRSVLPDADGAVAFSMQCAFRTVAPGGFFCGPTGDVAPYVDQAYDGTFAATPSFDDGRGGSVTCDVDAICVAVVAVLGPDLSLVGGTGVPITFSQPADATSTSLPLNLPDSIPAFSDAGADSPQCRDLMRGPMWWVALGSAGTVALFAAAHYTKSRDLSRGAAPELR